MNRIDAMKQALSLLENGVYEFASSWDDKAPTIISNLRQAIERVEQQRIGWLKPCREGWVADIDNAPMQTGESLPLYLHPAPPPSAWNRSIRDSVDSLLRQAGYAEDSSVRHQLACMDFDVPTAPAQQPLTEEQIFDTIPGGIIDCLLDPYDEGVGDRDESRSVRSDIVRIVRSIEAKHGIE